jgi:hypothetical protein
LSALLALALALVLVIVLVIVLVLVLVLVLERMCPSYIDHPAGLACGDR